MAALQPKRRGRRRMSMDARIQGKIERITETGCWIYMGALNHAGYGTMGNEKAKTEGAHRVSYRTYRGPIPSGLQVCHHCDTPACCNPNHLFLGTAMENRIDMLAKGRDRRPERKLVGKDPAQHSLTSQQVTQIRALRICGTKIKTLACQFETTELAVFSICFLTRPL